MPKSLFKVHSGLRRNLCLGVFRKCWSWLITVFYLSALGRILPYFIPSLHFQNFVGIGNPAELLQIKLQP